MTTTSIILKSLEVAFLAEGGIREKMTKERIDQRDKKNHPK